MKLRNFVFPLLTVLVMNPVYADEMYTATITYLDGVEKTVSIEFPLVSNTKEITISQARGKEEKVGSELLAAIDLRTPNGKEYRLERIYVTTYGKKHKETFTSINMVWAYRLRTDSKMDYYAIGSEYRIRKKEKDMMVVSKGALGQVMHCFQRPGEEGATSVHSSTGGGVIVGNEKYFLNSLTAYFRDNPGLVKRIEKGEFEEESLLTLYEAYCKL